MTQERGRPRIALVVPGLALGGGVPAVARFVKDTILGADRHDLALISLSMSSRDELSWNLLSPRTWGRKPRSSPGTWDGHAYCHVGAWAGDLEFQRYRPRKGLYDLLAECDLIQVVAGAPAWANTVLGIGKPVSLQCATLAQVERRTRDAAPTGIAGQWRKAMTRVTARMDDNALRRVDAIQVENPWMLDHARAVNAGRDVDIRYAPPGVDIDQFRPAGHRNLAEDNYILCVGRLDDPRKNVALLLEAYARLPDSTKATTVLVLAGSAAPKPAFWSRVELLGVRDRIRYIAKPDHDQLVALYQGAVMFVLSSDEEGLGVVILEAMACGIPVVATRCGGPDGIIDDGRDGILVPLGDAAAMAGAIGRILADPALNRAMGRRARMTIEARYADGVAGAAFLDAWDRLLARPGSR